MLVSVDEIGCMSISGFTVTWNKPILVRKGRTNLYL